MTRDPLRVGVIGLGRAFTLMLPTWTGDPRVRLVAGCDPRPEARARFESDFGTPAFDDARALVEHPAVEVVVVASPHARHAGHVALAAGAGRAVLVEKPMALSVADCSAMIDACDRAGVPLVVGPSHGWDTPVAAARALLDTGVLGAVRAIHAFDYTDFLYRPRRPDELDAAQGGGVVMSQATHQLDVVRRLAAARPRSVHAVVQRWDDTRPIDVAYQAMLWFDGGAVASLVYSGAGHFDSDLWMDGVGETGRRRDPSAEHGGARRRLAQAGSRDDEARLKHAATYGGSAWSGIAAAAPAAYEHFGPVIVQCERGALRPMPHALVIDRDHDREHRPLPAPAVPRAEVVDALWAAVRDRVPPLLDGRWGRTTVAICTAMLESARLGAPVSLHAG